MNHLTLSAALATCAVIVPAGWDTLDADIQSDGPKLRPKQQSFAIGDATITLDLDRGAMPAGGKASVTLVATSAHRHKVVVDLRALENMGYSGERVELPPRLVDARTVTLDAQPGGGPPVVQTFRLGRAHHTGSHEWFDIVAQAPKGAGDGDAARVGLATWGGNDFAMTIEPPAALPGAGAFTIAVRIKNTTKKPMPAPEIEVGGTIRGVDGLDSTLAISTADYEIEPVADPAAPDAGTDDAPIAPGAESLQVYRVTPARWGIDHFVFVAQARSEGLGALATATMDRPAADDPDAGGAVAAR